MFRDIPVVFILILILYTLYTKSQYGFYMLVSLVVLAQLGVFIKIMGAELDAWKAPPLHDQFCGRILDHQGYLPSGHVATLACIGMMWYLYAGNPLILVFMTIMIVLNWKASIEKHCHTHLQLLAGLIYGGLFGWAMYKIYKIKFVE